MGKSKDIYSEPKTSEVKSLKKRIAKLEHENKRLKSELKTYEQMFRKTVTFLKKDTEELTIHQIIKGVDADETLFEIKEKVKERWACFSCPEGILKLILVPGDRYFRKCNACSKRTKVQDFNENVEQ